MKRILQPLLLLAAAAALLAPFRLFADTEVVDGIQWTYRVSNGQASVGNSSGIAIATSTIGAITIPATLGNCPVKSIGGNAFRGCSGLTSITIPDSITSIGSRSFENCSGLTSITIPDSVTSIGNYAFNTCYGLTSITIPDSVTSIGDYAFNTCYGLTSITIPDSVTSIGDYAFCNCFGLTSITIPDSVTSIGSRAFAHCSGLTSVTIPDSETSIGNLAFASCSGLTSITIPDRVTNIGGNAFRGCSGLTTVTMKSIAISREVLEGSALFDNIETVFCYRAGSATVLGACGSKSVTVRYLDDGTTIFQADILSASIRKNDPTVMDVDYIVYSDSPTVNVRALAFEDGDRGFATVVRPETFIEGTDSNLGDGIAANVAHRLSWKVSSDWATDLAKVKFEVLAMKPGDLLLPMHFVTIPAAEEHPKTIVSVNNLCDYSLSGSKGRIPALLDALLWLFASNDESLILDNGQLFCKTEIGTKGSRLVEHNSFLSDMSDCSTVASAYVFGKMGFRRLDVANEIQWLREDNRIPLSLEPKWGFYRGPMFDYAVKSVEE